MYLKGAVTTKVFFCTSGVGDTVGLSAGVSSDDMGFKDGPGVGSAAARRRVAVRTQISNT